MNPLSDTAFFNAESSIDNCSVNQESSTDLRDLNQGGPLQDPSTNSASLPFGPASSAIESGQTKMAADDYRGLSIHDGNSTAFANMLIYY